MLNISFWKINRVGVGRRGIPTSFVERTNSQFSTAAEFDVVDASME
jgi:hypothetical protein